MRASVRMQVARRVVRYAFISTAHPRHHQACQAASKHHACLPESVRICCRWQRQHGAQKSSSLVMVRCRRKGGSRSSPYLNTEKWHRAASRRPSAVPRRSRRRYYFIYSPMFGEWSARQRYGACRRATTFRVSSTRVNRERRSKENARNRCCQVLASEHHHPSSTRNVRRAQE